MERYDKNIGFVRATHQLTIIDPKNNDSKTISFIHNIELVGFFDDIKSFLDIIKKKNAKEIKIQTYPKRVSTHVLTLRDKNNNKSKSISILLENYSCEDIMKEIKLYFCWEGENE